jgi:hypothetical protein
MDVFLGSSCHSKTDNVGVSTRTNKVDESVVNLDILAESTVTTFELGNESHFAYADDDDKPDLLQLIVDDEIKQFL